MTLLGITLKAYLAGALATLAIVCFVDAWLFSRRP